MEDQDFMENEDKWRKVLSLIPDKEMKERIEKLMPKCQDSAQRWETLKMEVESTRLKKVSY